MCTWRSKTSSCKGRFHSRAMDSSPNALRQLRVCPNSRLCATAPAISRPIRSRNLDLYLEAYEKQVAASGGIVHYARTAEEANDIVVSICRRARRKAHRQGQDDGRRGDRRQRCARSKRYRRGRNRPRRIYHPATRRDAIAHHRARGASHQGADRRGFPPHASRSAGGARSLRAERAAGRGARRAYARNFWPPMSASPAPISSSPRPALRSSSPTKAMAISPQTLPKVHIVLASIEKLVPTLEDASQLLRVLARSATGQDMSVYTTFVNRAAPPRRSRRPRGISRGPRSTTAARPCSAAISPRSCAASAAAPA